MADLTGTNLDPNVEENTGGYIVIEPGNYVAVIVADRITDTKAKDGKILELKVQIAEGKYKGEIIKDGLNIVNKSAQAQAIAQGQLRRICSICGVTYPPANTNGIIGKPLKIKVINEPFISNKTGENLTSNKIKSYDSIAVTQTQTPSNDNMSW